MYIYIYIYYRRTQEFAVSLALATALSWVASDTAHSCVHLYNICGKTSLWRRAEFLKAV